MDPMDYAMKINVTFYPGLEFLCDTGFTFTMVLSFFAHRMYQLGVVYSKLAPQCFSLE